MECRPCRLHSPVPKPPRAARTRNPASAPTPAQCFGTPSLTNKITPISYALRVRGCKYLSIGSPAETAEDKPLANSNSMHHPAQPAVKSATPRSDNPLSHEFLTRAKGYSVRWRTTGRIFNSMIQASCSDQEVRRAPMHHTTQPLASDRAHILATNHVAGGRAMVTCTITALPSFVQLRLRKHRLHDK